MNTLSTQPRQIGQILIAKGILSEDQLRIALLECAPEVGTAVPVLADDILVNFDDDRRAGAARALAELAQSRQVIVFTCHKEVVSTFNEQAQNVHVLDI